MSGQTGRPAKYPLRKLAVGESILIVGTTQVKINKVRKVYAPMKFRCRTVMAGGVKSCRVERVQ